MLDLSFLDRIRAAGSGASTTFEVKSPIDGRVVAMGASIGYHLALRGCTDVLVLERAESPVTGSTARSAAGVRHQFATEVNIRLSRYSIERRMVGGESGVAAELFTPASRRRPSPEGSRKGCVVSPPKGRRGVGAAVLEAAEHGVELMVLIRRRAAKARPAAAAEHCGPAG